MQGCGYAARRRTGIGHMAFWFPAVLHLAVALLFSHPMLVGIGVLVSWFRLCPMLLGYGSLRFVAAQGLWIMEAHEVSGEF